MGETEHGGWEAGVVQDAPTGLELYYHQIIRPCSGGCGDFSDQEVVFQREHKPCERTGHND